MGAGRNADAVRGHGQPHVTVHRPAGHHDERADPSAALQRVGDYANNSVYRVRQKVRESDHELGADQFAAKINEIRKTWHEKGQECQRTVPNPPFEWEEHQKRDRNGLCIFSGDLFTPSVESSITRGAHMVPVVNAMQVDAACLGK